MLTVVLYICVLFQSKREPIKSHCCKEFSLSGNVCSRYVDIQHILLDLSCFKEIVF